MAGINQNEIDEYINHHIASFHKARILSLTRLKLENVLKRKNPYLFKAKNLESPQDFVKSLLDAHLSSQEETLLGGFLEGLAIFIANKCYGGKKSPAEGIDLQIDLDGKTYLIAIKSGPNWGNSSQIARMKSDFNKAKKILGQNRDSFPVIAVNGCCYGRQSEKAENKGEYIKLCGQRFWEFISGDSELYKTIISPLGKIAKQQNSEFNMQYQRVLEVFTALFAEDFCDSSGAILWAKLTAFSSAAKPPILRPRAVRTKVSATDKLRSLGEQAEDRMRSSQN